MTAMLRAHDSVRSVEAALRADNLAKKYQSGEQELVVFSGLNLEVQRGERVAIIGESGAGKSTLLHLLGCLDRPSEGRIYLGQREVSGLGEPELSEIRRRVVGFVWQMNTLLGEFTALENVMMPLLVRGTKRREAADSAGDRLREVGLAERASHRAGELSGGEQQRVVLARALVAQPALLLADEPTGNLDERTGAMIIDLLEQVHETHRLTTVLVTHNPRFSGRCHRILRLEKGALRDARADEEPG
jgi:lipoprotein-releasing system ATP-binding protein